MAIKLTNPHHTKDMKTKQKESEANNIKARPQVKKGPSDKVYNAVVNALMVYREKLVRH